MRAILSIKRLTPRIVLGDFALKFKHVQVVMVNQDIVLREFFLSVDQFGTIFALFKSLKLREFKQLVGLISRKRQLKFFTRSFPSKSAHPFSKFYFHFGESVFVSLGWGLKNEAPPAMESSVMCLFFRCRYTLVHMPRYDMCLYPSLKNTKYKINDLRFNFCLKKKYKKIHRKNYAHRSRFI